jgi:hypothetical protein
MLKFLLEKMAKNISKGMTGKEFSLQKTVLGLLLRKVGKGLNLV